MTLDGIEIAIPGLGALGLFLYLVFKQIRTDRSIWDAIEELRKQRDEYKRRTSRAEKLVALYRTKFGLIEEDNEHQIESDT